MKREELTQVVRAWIETTPGAGDSADWLLDRAQVKGEIPKQPTLDAAVPWQNALASFFSSRFVRLSDRGRKFTIDFDRWEQEQFGESGVLLPILAECRGRPLANRRQERQLRKTQIADLLSRYADDDGLQGHVAGVEFSKLNLQQGRFWSRSSRCTSIEMERELEQYFRLLRHVEELRRDAGRVDRIVHVSRIVAGDTHWFRPSNRIWRDLAEDILDFDADLKSRLNGMDRHETFARALAEYGIVENLTSVVVLVYGYFGLQRKDAIWRWPEEAAHERQPVWLAAIHLNGSRVMPAATINRVITVENETSFLDLIEQYGDDVGTVLVYTEGQANRAVIAALRLLSEAGPEVQFQHQGDLDLPGVRILASLCARSSLPIKPMCMDAKTHQRFAAPGILLTGIEYEDVMRELNLCRLPCLDLLKAIAVSKRRIEQESITAAIRECR